MWSSTASPILQAPFTRLPPQSCDRACWSPACSTGFAPLSKSLSLTSLCAQEAASFCPSLTVNEARPQAEAGHGAACPLHKGHSQTCGSEASSFQDPCHSLLLPFTRCLLHTPNCSAASFRLTYLAKDHCRGQRKGQHPPF